MDLEKLINEKVTETLDNKLTELISDKVHKCIDTILSDLFRSYGSLSKQLEEQLKTSLQINLSQVGIETYNERVMKAVKASLDKIMDERAVKMVEEQVAELVSYSFREEIKMSELVDEFAKSFRWQDGDYMEPTIIIEQSNYGTTYISLDEESDKDRYKCAYQLSIDKMNKVWSYECRGYFGKKDNMAIHGDFEKLMFALYANKTKIVIDEYQTEFYRNED